MKVSDKAILSNRQQLGKCCHDLAQRAAELGQEEIGVILLTAAASIASGTDTELAVISAKFSQDQLKAAGL